MRPGSLLDLDNPRSYLYLCPYCDADLATDGLHFPGMRKLIELFCPGCGTEFYGDLPAGFGLYYPHLLERDSGEVFHPYTTGGGYFAQLLEESYRNRTDKEIEIKISGDDPVDVVVILNCLDNCYGHVLGKLLHSQYYIEQTDLDVVVLIPESFEWLVPPEVSQMWAVDIPLREGHQWNNWFADRLREFIKETERCYLAMDGVQIHPRQFDIEYFTGVTPFSLDDWHSEVEQPTITFVWRDVNPGSQNQHERLWCTSPSDSTASPQNPSQFLIGWRNALTEKFGYYGFIQREQRNNIVSVSKQLRKLLATVDIRVAGIGDYGSFPDWISDQRHTNLTPEKELELCECYASSHLVVGIHSSGMKLPALHAGGIVELVPTGHSAWGRRYSTGTFLRSTDPQTSVIRSRFIPAELSNTKIATIIDSFLQGFPYRYDRDKVFYNMHSSGVDTDDLKTLQSLMKPEFDLIRASEGLQHSKDQSASHPNDQKRETE